MFSRRLPWPCHPNRLSRLLDDKKARGAAVLDLTESNPTRAGLAYPAEAIAAALADQGSARYEPAPRGLKSARAAVAAHSAGRGGRPLREDRIVLTAGTSEAYALLFKLLADPGDSVLVPRPGYPLFDYLAALEGLTVSTYPLLQERRFCIDLDALERAPGGPGPGSLRAIVVVSPNNPTGSALRRSERSRIREICARRDAALIADEVFIDFLDRGSIEEAERAGDPIVSALSGGLDAAEGDAGGTSAALTFVLGGLSKSCGLPQMKLGWIGVEGPEETAGEALERLDLIADTYLSVGTPVMRAAARLLEIGAGIRTGIRRRIDGNLDALREALEPGSGCSLLRRDGGWYAVVQIPAIVPEEDLVLALLREDDVLVHPGYFFDFPREAYLVLSLLPEPGSFAEALRRVLSRVHRR